MRSACANTTTASRGSSNDSSNTADIAQHNSSCVPHSVLMRECRTLSTQTSLAATDKYVVLSDAMLRWRWRAAVGDGDGVRTSEEDINRAYKEYNKKIKYAQREKAVRQLVCVYDKDGSGGGENEDDDARLCLREHARAVRDADEVVVWFQFPAAVLTNVELMRLTYCMATALALNKNVHVIGGRQYDGALLDFLYATSTQFIHYDTFDEFVITTAPSAASSRSSSSKRARIDAPCPSADTRSTK